ncbi:MAG: Gfo/Idh/MocA family protein [Armatimonadota bacterium]
MAKVRIGFIGAGSMGQCAHLQNYVNIEECEVVALAELRPQLGRAVAHRYGIPKVYSSHEELLANEKVDGLVASQPFTRHGTLVPELLKAGAPVFTEKPIAGSVEQGEKIVAAVEQSGTWLMVGYHKRSDPATRAAKIEIDRLRHTRELGRLTYVRILMPAGDWVASGFNNLIRCDESPGELTFDPPPADMTPQGYEAYTAFVNYYIHQVNLLRHLLGEPYDVTHADSSGVLLVAQSESGIPGVIEMSPYETTVDWQEAALVAFERGWVKLELPAPLAHNRPGSVEFYRDPGGGARPETVTPDLPWVHAMRQQALNFISAIRGDEKPPCEAAEALEDLRVAEQYIRLRGER